MKTYKDFIKKTDKNGVLECWIEQPFFKPSDFKEVIEQRYNHRLNSVTNNELTIENETQFIKEELEDLQKLIKPKPTYDYEKLSFAERITGYWFSDETLNEFERYFNEYYKYCTYKFKLEYLENKLESIEKSKISETETSNFKDIHPKHNPNLWTRDCFDLFKYLYDEYYKGTNRQLTNIWFYLKESRSSKYILKATKDQYKEFLLNSYDKKITNFDKAQTKWEDKECNTINDHRVNFEDSLK